MDRGNIPRNSFRFIIWQVIISATILFTLGCKNASNRSEKIKIDGSGTVFPITEAVVEEYLKKFPGRKLMVGLSGTGGGIKKFCRNDIDIVNASRSIKEKEIQACGKNKIGFAEITVAFDGLAILVHPSNNWISSITVQELKKIWEPKAQNKILRWNQIRPEWPDEEIHLYGAGVASGTYDYFTEVIVGESRSSRGDYTASEDDNVLIQGISMDPFALGFFGIAYYEENKEKLKLIPVDDGKSENGDGPIFPTPETIRNNTYAPLSRPLFIYVNDRASKRTDIQEFVDFYLTHIESMVLEVGYIPLPKESYEKERKKFFAFIQKIK